MTIWKYEINLKELAEKAIGIKIISMPNHAQIRFVGVQETNICLWAEVVPDRPLVDRTFYIVGTGHPIPTNACYYVGSVQMPPFVWHIYEGK